MAERVFGNSWSAPRRPRPVATLRVARGHRSRGYSSTPGRFGQEGHAILTALIATALLLPLGAFAVMQARLDFLIAHHTRAASETFAVAEAGLDRALADLARAPRFERLLAGPDRRVGTGDDGEYPFAEPPPAWFPAAPFRYEVRVAVRGADRVEIEARGHGPLGAVRGVAAAVERSPLPYVPAALASAGEPLDLLFGPGWRIDGAAGVDGAPDVPALAVASGAVAEQLAARLAPGDASRLRGPGGEPSLGIAPLPDLAALLAAAARHGDVQALPADAGGALGDGLFMAGAGLRLRDASGSGILLVDGPLAIDGRFAFDGIVAATGGITVGDGAAVALNGALLQGQPGGALLLRGDGQLIYDQRIIDRLAARYAGLLPSRARITGWRELPDAAG